jgi:hypothetical protein
MWPLLCNRQHTGSLSIGSPRKSMADTRQPEPHDAKCSHDRQAAL